METRTGAVNTPLRGAKGTLFEGGIRVPWAMRWPGRIKPATVVDEPVIAIDLLPTFVAVGGGTVRDAWKLDGRNLVPLLDGEDESKKPRAFFWRKHGSKGIYAIRDGKWKMIIDKSDKSELPGKALFDLSADISESKNVLKEFPDVASRLDSQLEKWSKELHEPLWGPNAKKKMASPRATR